MNKKNLLLLVYPVLLFIAGFYWMMNVSPELHDRSYTTTDNRELYCESGSARAAIKCYDVTEEHYVSFTTEKLPVPASPVNIKYSVILSLLDAVGVILLTLGTIKGARAIMLIMQKK